MTDLIRQVFEDLHKQIEGFESDSNISDIRTVVKAGDGITYVHDLVNVEARELSF